jgi:hypothetical protein
VCSPVPAALAPFVFHEELKGRQTSLSHTHHQPHTYKQTRRQMSTTIETTAPHPPLPLSVPQPQPHAHPHHPMQSSHSQPGPPMSSFEGRPSSSFSSQPPSHSQPVVYQQPPPPAQSFPQYNRNFNAMNGHAAQPVLDASQIYTVCHEQS